MHRRFGSSGRMLPLLAAVAATAAAGAAAAPMPHPESNPLFAAEWWLRGQATLTDHEGATRVSDGVDAIRAWSTSTGAGVVVAVLDSGIDRREPALQGQLARAQVAQDLRDLERGSRLQLVHVLAVPAVPRLVPAGNLPLLKDLVDGRDRARVHDPPQADLVRIFRRDQDGDPGIEKTHLVVRFRYLAVPRQHLCLDRADRASARLSSISARPRALSPVW